MNTNVITRRKELALCFSLFLTEDAFAPEQAVASEHFKVLTGFKAERYRHRDSDTCESISSRTYLKRNVRCSGPEKLPVAKLLSAKKKREREKERERSLAWSRCSAKIS